METVPLVPDQPQSYEALLAFLEGCRELAVDRDHPQLVSIATEAEALDPLAVLESIYESQQPHFYLERKREGMAIAGAEEAIRFSPEGPDRFARVASLIEETLEHTVAVGDPDLPFFGPHFFCGFTFFDRPIAGAPFAPSTVFAPRWQVSTMNGRCVACANAMVHSDSDCEAIAKRIWNANTKFRTFDFDRVEESVKQRAERKRLKLLETGEKDHFDGFARSIGVALEAIKRGDFDKIVLARALDLVADQAFHPLEILNTLRERYSECYAFSIANGEGQSFIGASPERLVAVRNGSINVDALAGTAPRGGTASEDAFLGRTLLDSEKDRREHAIVFDSIRRRLHGLGIEVDTLCRPRLKKLQNVQHLHVDMQAKLPNSVSLLDIVAALHPTPAVGGMPREAAIGRIAELEPFERGLYAGPIGWVNAKGEGEFVVAIRSALVENQKARLFAGVGIVAGSIPEREYEETNLKFKALLENLL